MRQEQLLCTQCLIVERIERIWLSQKELILIKYKIINTLAEHLDKEDAKEALYHMQLLNPGKKLEIQEYNWSDLEKRLGRDPDLH